MNSSYVGSLALFVIALAVFAVAWGYFLPWINPVLLGAIAIVVYGAGVILDLLPPGRPRRPREADATGTDTLLGVAGLASLVAVVVIGTVLITRSDDEATSFVQGSAGPATATPPTAASTATATPSPEPTATPTPVPPTPEAPPGAFVYCENLYSNVYDCGPSPWRVICSPDGYFFDPEGVIPDPIPTAWEGWSETTLTGRLEFIHGACD